MTQRNRGLDPDEAASVSLTKKQVSDKMRRRESLAEQDMRGLDLSGL